MWKREKLRARKSAWNGKGWEQQMHRRRPTNSLVEPLLPSKEESRGRAWYAQVSAVWVHFREVFGSTIRYSSARSLVI
jgi:hypothetical protein